MENIYGVSIFFDFTLLLSELHDVRTPAHTLYICRFIANNFLNEMLNLTKIKKIRLKYCERTN